MEAMSWRSVALSAGTIRYREVGEGPPVVFVHGVLVNGELWRKVAPTVAAAGFRCLVPDWPLGSHTTPVPRADLTPPGVAALIGEFLDRLDLHDVTVVANDTGGAFTQLLLASGAADARLKAVVFTPSDAFERFFPPLFGYLPLVARDPMSTWLMTQLLRLPAVRRLPIGYGWLTMAGLPAEVAASYTTPARLDGAIRADLRRVLRGVHRRHTLAAAPKLRAFTKPVSLAWASEDRLFPLGLGERLAAAFPDATLVPIPGSYTFVPEDQPEPLARHIVEFARAHAQP